MARRVRGAPSRYCDNGVWPPLSRQWGTCDACGVAFEPAIARPGEPGADDLVALYAGNALVIGVDAGALPRRSELGALGEADTVHVGTLDGASVETLRIDEGDALPAGFELVPLRPLHGRLDDETWAVAGRAFQLAEWDRTHRFCGVCGAPTERLADDRARACTACGFRAYPRHSPAVIVLVTRGDEVLLGRSPHFPPGMYSTLAGFVDPGESAEAAVRREVREEAGVEIGEPQWFGSQSWAFPHSLMLGFTAEWASGELAHDPAELEDARWFTRDDLPVLPPPASIARRLLESWR